jgi:hypothetical protein
MSLLPLFIAGRHGDGLSKYPTECHLSSSIRTFSLGLIWPWPWAYIVFFKCHSKVWWVRCISWWHQELALPGRSFEPHTGNAAEEL